MKAAAVAVDVVVTFVPGVVAVGVASLEIAVKVVAVAATGPQHYVHEKANYQITVLGQYPD